MDVYVSHFNKCSDHYCPVQLCSDFFTLVFPSSSDHPSLPPLPPLPPSPTVRQVFVCSLAPAVTPPLVLSSLHLPLSCSSGIFLWANRKPRLLVTRPPVPAPANCVPVNQRRYFPFPTVHFHPHVRYICFSPCFWRRLVTNLHTICRNRVSALCTSSPVACACHSLGWERNEEVKRLLALV